MKSCEKELEKILENSTPDSELDYFLSHFYHDMRFFYNAISRYQATSSTYFGDMQANLFYISDNLRDTFGFEHNLVYDLLGKWKSRIHGDRCKLLYERNINSILTEKKEVHDLRYQVSDCKGNLIWIRCCGSLQWDEDKTKPLFFAGRVTRQDDSFTVDPVTNFPTPDTLQRSLTQLEKNPPFLTIGFRFNNIPHINTLYGRDVADRMIRKICRQLMDTLGDKMTFYRMTGVRCMALVDQAISESKEDLINEIQDIISRGYRDLDIAVSEPCSFAVMTFPQKNLSAKDFLENMVTLIKIAHRDPTAAYAEDTQQNLQRIHQISSMEMAITQDVMHGMENFRAVIQPIVCSETGHITSGETLMRWKYNGQDVSPAVFIPTLEKNRLIYIAGRWIIEQAIEACAQIIQHLPDFYLSVNLSLQQLYDEELTDYIPQMLKKYHLDGRHLVVEITESCMDLEPAKLCALMNTCQKMGVRIALDDFGTGYSSLRVLLKYPTNIIKLDRSLLLEMTESSDKSNFINSIVFACHQFGKKVCMEGVEDENQRMLTRDAQCDLIQGFYFYKPTEIEDVYAIVERQAKQK